MLLMKTGKNITMDMSFPAALDLIIQMALEEKLNTPEHNAAFAVIREFQKQVGLHGPTPMSGDLATALSTIDYLVVINGATAAGFSDYEAAWEYAKEGEASWQRVMRKTDAVKLFRIDNETDKTHEIPLGDEPDAMLMDNMRPALAVRIKEKLFPLTALIDEYLSHDAIESGGYKLDSAKFVRRALRYFLESHS